MCTQGKNDKTGTKERKTLKTYYVSPGKTEKKNRTEDVTESKPCLLISVFSQLSSFPVVLPLPVLLKLAGNLVLLLKDVCVI